MADSGATKSSGMNLAAPLMILAFLSIGGFLYWLNLSSAAYVEAFNEEREAMEAEETVDGTPVAMEDIQMDPAGWIGQEIRLEGIPVVSRVGSYAFWTEFPNQTPFLVRIAQQGVVVETGWTADAVGQIYPMTDSVLDAWEAEGILADEDQRFEAEFATEFFQAIQLDLDRGETDENENSEGDEGN